jgi:glutamine amidotransferase
MRATILDLGAGNLHSLSRALSAVDFEVRVLGDPQLAVCDTDWLVLPGVGAFGPAAEQLRPALQTLRSALSAGLPCLGVCLGMQLLFERSEEGEGEGLAVFAGEVTRLRARQVPHIGWSVVEDLGALYFAHGYACRPGDPADVVAWADHGGDRFAAVVRRDKVVGFQFHPEKSSRAGLALLAQLRREGP